MKKNLSIVLAALSIFAAACTPQVLTKQVNISLSLNDEAYAKADVVIAVSDAAGMTFEAVTNEAGQATINLPVGLYNAAASFKDVSGARTVVYNGDQTFTVALEDSEVSSICEVVINLSESYTSDLIIKELYTGGCADNAGTGSYAYDKYVIIYNNSGAVVDASKLCIAMSGPISSSIANKYVTDGVYSFEKDKWMPAFYGVWWFAEEKKVEIQPYSQIVIAINGAVDHTKTYSKSVDLSNADYAMYCKTAGFNQAASYPAPAFSDTTRCMRTVRLGGTTTAWPLHQKQPSLFLFQQDGFTAQALSDDTEHWDHTISTAAANNALKIPFASICDAVEAFEIGAEAKSTSRFPASLNAGYVSYTSKLGYSIYRNVDEEATLALPENEGKIVRGYAATAVEGSTDPSGIDAEASIAAGAHIVYKNTNNTSADFHTRNVASLKK